MNGGTFLTQDLGRQIVGAPATILNGGEQEIYYGGNNGELYETYNVNGGPFFTQDLGTQIVGSPATILNGGEQEIYYRNPNGELYETYNVNGAFLHSGSGHGGNCRSGDHIQWWATRSLLF